MILEGIITTLDPNGAVHITPLGPEVGVDADRLILKPYRTSQTYRNLRAHGEGVFHVTDDVLLLARAAVGKIEPLPDLAVASQVRGRYLTGCCRYLEFRVRQYDDALDRTRLTAEVMHTGRLRDFFGFNRGKHAVVEAAILATRIHLLPAAQIAVEYDRLEVLVQKTGGPAEHEAFRILRHYLAEAPGRT